MKKLIDIIIPTFNNEQFLNPCLMSIVRTGELSGFANLIIVNNGKQPIRESFGGIPGLTVLEPGENLGWEKGLELGLKNSSAPFVVFQNDDTFIPCSSHRIYQNLLMLFSNPDVAAVGPTTTVAAGLQSIFHPNSPSMVQEVTYLIFFMVMLRRKHLEEVGGIDTGLPGGDDFDLCIRLRNAGKKLYINPGAFLIHHGFKTGNRVHGGADTPGGWNSLEMFDRTNQFLIQKHGFRNYFRTMAGRLDPKPPEQDKDLEGDLVRDWIVGDQIVELGCGPKKTVPNAIGVDWTPAGEKIQHHPLNSMADVVADVGKPLPFEENSKDTVIARHILEHLQDSVVTVKNWSKILKPKGRLIVAVPDQEVVNGIPLNPEHLHAFTRDSMKSLMEVCGMKEVGSKYAENLVSFVGCYEKN